MTFEEYKELTKKYKKLIKGDFTDDRLKEIKEILVFHDFYNKLIKKRIDAKKTIIDNLDAICEPVDFPKIKEYEEYLKYLDSCM